MKSTNRIIGLILSIALCLGAAGLGAIATTPEIDGWYKTILKPTWNPPASVFGPVWTILFVLMGVAVWLVWEKPGFKMAGLAMAMFAVQLVLNVAWSWIFFRLHAPGWAFVEIVILWLSIAATIALFLKHRKLAGLLMLPYLAWVSFASVLNFTIWRLNV